MEVVTIQLHAQYPATKFLGYLRSHSTPDMELTTADQTYAANFDRSLPTTRFRESRCPKVWRVKDATIQPTTSIKYVSFHEKQHPDCKRAYRTSQQHRLDARTGYLGSGYQLNTVSSPYVYGCLMESRCYIQLVLGIQLSVAKSTVRVTQ